MRRRLALAALVLAAAVALYAPTVAYGFVWDDISLIRDNRYLHDGSRLAENLGSDFFRRTGNAALIGHWRPLPLASYMLDWRVGGGRASTFHAHNALLHGVGSALLVLLAFELGLSELAAVAAGILFAVLPVHVEAVAWISGRPDLLCGLFVIAALAADARAASNGRRRWRAAAAAATLLALLAKEMAVVVPLAVGLRAWWRPGGAERAVAPWLRSVRAMRLQLAAVAAYAVVRWGVFGIAPRASAAASAGRPALFWTWWSAFLEYARVLVWPARLGIVPRVALTTSPWSPRVLLGVSLFALCAWAAWRLRRARPVTAWALACFLLSLGPVTSFLVLVRAPAGVVFPWAERFLFVPSLFFALAIAAAVAPPGGARIRRGAAVAVAAASVALAARSLAREPVWRDQRALFTAAVREAPGDAPAHASLGAALADAGDLAGAEEHDRIALALAPKNTIAHYNLGNLLRLRGELDGAEASYRAAIAGEPAFAQAWLNLGLVQVARGRAADAMAAFTAADDALGGYPEAKVDKASLLLAAGHPQEAIALYEDALRLDPSLEGARRGLAAARNHE